MERRVRLLTSVVLYDVELILHRLLHCRVLVPLLWVTNQKHLQPYSERTTDQFAHKTAHRDRSLATGSDDARGNMAAATFPV